MSATSQARQWRADMILLCNDPVVQPWGEAFFVRFAWLGVIGVFRFCRRFALNASIASRGSKGGVGLAPGCGSRQRGGPARGRVGGGEDAIVGIRDGQAQRQISLFDDAVAKQVQSQIRPALNQFVQTGRTLAVDIAGASRSQVVAGRFSLAE